MHWPLAVGVFFAVMAVAWVGTGRVAAHLRGRAILDHPNERSSHGAPTPRGGGLAVVPAILAGWIVLALADLSPAPWTVMAAAAALAALSWLDDRRGLGPLPRLLGHIAAVAMGIALIPNGSLVFQGLLPPLADRLAAFVAWLWFVNLFNFMDGIDGLAGVEAAFIGLGLAAVLALFGPATVTGVALAAALVAAAALGFLRWNWHPARIFLGDVGSVPLGYLLGWLLLQAAAMGAWVAALILPLYFLADATLTLLRRIASGHKPWHAHRTHFYQRALARGFGHAQVVRRVMLANVALFALALGGEGGYPAYALAGAAGVVALLLGVLALARRADAPENGGAEG